MNLYNDIDPKVCAWLTELVRRGLIPHGEVWCRSITEIQPNELTRFTQVHLFAGIGGWSLALRLAGWPDDRPVWTGSCPCQPFSAAGKQLGTADERHLWPHFYRLISECRPPVVFGEQVASALGRTWLAGVRTDLEALDYAVGSADLCAAGVGAPHIRQRLWWVADCDRGRFEVCAQPHGEPLEREQSAPFGNNAGRRGAVGGVADASLRGLTEQRGAGAAGRGGHDDERGAVGGLGNASGCRLSQSNREKQAGQRGQAGHWAGATTIPCGDGKTQRIEPGLAPLVDGVPARVVRLRGYGNAIVPQVAAEFVAAYMEIE